MLRWLSLALVLATSVVFAGTTLESKDPSDAVSQCGARAWVRAPDMVPGDVIAGDVRIKLSGPCTKVKSYVLGLRYKEKIFWRLRREDAPIPKKPPLKNKSDYQITGIPHYDSTELKAYHESLMNETFWSVHEEEQIAFEIKNHLVDAEQEDPLPTTITTRFGILVPNTNYPPGLDYRHSMVVTNPMSEDDTISSESIYEYFVEIRFSNGSNLVNVPAGMTAFTPSSLPTENDAPPLNVSLASSFNNDQSADALRSNYTVEVSFPDGSHVYQNSYMNITAIVYRTGYTNRTDIPVKLCAHPGGPSIIEWNRQELKNRLQPYLRSIYALVPIHKSRQPFVDSCQKIKFAAGPADFTHEGYLSTTSSEPISLTFYVGREHTVPDFLTYYQKLGHVFSLDLNVRPDPSEPWDDEFERDRWEKQTVGMDETDVDWIPLIPPTGRRTLWGNIRASVIPMQQQGPVRQPPVHYLSDEARQPVFVNLSDIAELRLMSSEERDLIAPLVEPSFKVFAKGEEIPSRYGRRQRIYVGDSWINKVLPKVAEGQVGERERNIAEFFVVQGEVRAF
ncbi:hypothetical protein DEU56DRAFT_456901 [Suillus clintonianus]|uniref:uncharacterized protein n=1 Tax=Suillus clintonianus TaxID=1904413 RepID=UPI001B85E5D7|nr:uncharacterized protein DEU56DRAFT_456901 [Suillus clintonianus]KAG2131368.1 hypothetical protein DEU56DRAFT_456901 [Suillus clintonianus]